MRHETRITDVFDAGPILVQTPWSGLIASIIRVSVDPAFQREVQLSSEAQSDILSTL